VGLETTFEEFKENFYTVALSESFVFLQFILRPYKLGSVACYPVIGGVYPHAYCILVLPTRLFS